VAVHSNDVASLGTILGVWAHPDDETYLSAGIMAAAVASGARVVCVTATRGEEGSPDHDRWPPAAMGTVREAELMDALALLGVTEHHWLDYHDGACASVPGDEATRKIADIMETVNPDSVLTFGPEGMTGHPDHIAVSQWTTAACGTAAPEAELYYATTNPDWAERFVPPLEALNVYAPGTPPITPIDELAIYLVLDDHLAEKKFRAIGTQVSQVEWLLAAVGEELFRAAMAQENFRRAS
jgi:LmbE family N-acetylglucosaminyl deacetylase